MIVKIDQNNLPPHCKTCYQTDCYNQLLDTCSRCENAARQDIFTKSRYSTDPVYLKAVNESWLLPSMGGFSIVMAVIALISGIPSVGLAALFFSGGGLLKGYQIFKILRRMRSTDPDWLITHQRALIGLVTAGVGLLLGIAWLVLLKTGNYNFSSIQNDD